MTHRRPPQQNGNGNSLKLTCLAFIALATVIWTIVWTAPGLIDRLLK